MHKVKLTKDKRKLTNIEWFHIEYYFRGKIRHIKPLQIFYGNDYSVSSLSKFYFTAKGIINIAKIIINRTNIPKLKIRVIRPSLHTY